MTRRLRTLLICLCFGAILNAAVAWTIGLTVPVRMSEANERTGAGPGGFFGVEGADYWGWMVFSRELPHAVRVRSDWHDRGTSGGGSGGWPDDPAAPLIPPWAGGFSPEAMTPCESYHHTLMWEYGWPMRSLGGLVHALDKADSSTRGMVIEPYFALPLKPELLDDPNDFWDVRLLVYRPLWPGFAINTLFYAVVFRGLWWLFAAPLALRRRLRIRRGLCQACAYPVGTSDRCSECGRSLVSQRDRPAGSSIMARRVRWICLLLVLASIVNMGVSWTLACLSPATSCDLAGDEYGARDRYPRWFMVQHRSSGAVVLFWTRQYFDPSDAPTAREFGDAWAAPASEHPRVSPPAWSTVDWRWSPPTYSDVDCLIEFASGWPTISFASSSRRFIGDDDDEALHPRWGIVLAQPATIEDWASFRMLPYRPIWPGIAINTVFYAAVLGLLFAVPCALRRRRRIKRGLCPKCAYPVGPSDVCTECGAPVSVRITEPAASP